MLTEETRKALQDFAKAVIRESKRNLTRHKKNASKSLHKSLDYDLDVGKNSFSLSFLMEQYGVFVNEGVKGANPSKVSKNAKIRGQQAPNSRYRFGSGKVGNYNGFVNNIEKWVKGKNLRLRDEKGRFKKGSQRTLSHIIAGNIYNRGIKPTLFFTKPFEKYYEQLPEELIYRFDLDIDKLLDHSLKDFK